VRVFLDANVLASALATRGLCADLLALVLAEHEMVTGEVVLRELMHVLKDRFGAPGKLAEAAVTLLRSFEVEPRPEAAPEISVRDPDDPWVLASALAARVDVLVTGDPDLLALGDGAGVRMVDPRGFWRLMRDRG